MKDPEKPHLSVPVKPGGEEHSFLPRHLANERQRILGIRHQARPSPRRAFSVQLLTPVCEAGLAVVSEDYEALVSH